ncbi:type I secretion protein [Mesorhizobium sp. DCY119]|uniref:type I secretion protein n=1 Tax=Mesorhizobium sp. DCY119 TaxID=2108445 RepID=UPI000E724F17|nr:type I secretion protein [Mesorhizobium sp. DCY119]RJG41636.1 type I secretion protein [Mesorhizobium sp. DCY119]
MDKITETIAHFIGLFQIAVEEARLRKDFDEFQAQSALAREQNQLLDVDVEAKAPYDFVGMDPGLRYQPLAPDLATVEPWLNPRYPALEGIVPGVDALPRDAPLVSAAGKLAAAPRVEFQIDPPGSLAVLINQEIRLSDNDYVGAGGHGLKFSPVSDHGAELAALLHGAARLAPLGDLDAPGSEEAIEGFILGTTAALKTFAEEHIDDGDVFVLKQQAIEGTYVNGKITADAPKLKDHLPDPDDDDDEAQHAGTVHSDSSLGSVEIEASVTLEAGSNTLVNSAALTNNWLAGPVMATVGDYVEVNAIIQTNVWSDNDAIGSFVGGWTFDPMAATEAFNIAVFARVDPTEDTSTQADAGAFPQHWAVTSIDGDLIFMNWIEQFSFVTDDDVHVLSSSGVKTTVATGDNTTLNDVSLTELGLYYDLIIVGGNIYDANFIQQMNVMLDDDLVGGVNGFHTTGDGSLSSSGNLLWNQAGIVNVGAGDRFAALPSHYKQTADYLKDGDKKLDADVLNDPSFSGVGTLRVLYVSGSIFDLQYIKQTNILGDSDEVALAMNGIEDSFPGAQWTISTGSNALINVAEIVDLDSTGKTYVGGNQYSDEILIQAELVSAHPELGGRDPDVLVNEAIAFLDDDVADHGDAASSTLQPTLDAPHGDVMQTMLA